MSSSSPSSSSSRSLKDLDRQQGLVHGRPPTQHTMEERSLEHTDSSAASAGRLSTSVDASSLQDRPASHQFLANNNSGGEERWQSGDVRSSEREHMDDHSAIISASPTNDNFPRSDVQRTRRMVESALPTEGSIHSRSFHRGSQPPSQRRPSGSDAEIYPSRLPFRTTVPRPVSTTREMVLPQWQADSEAPDCPICSRKFSFWFRKHHCRKCGRVVCAGCSPHRITIPRQFIVRPPDAPPRVSDTAPAPASPRPTISSEGSNTQQSLGGGEEVRLCNPCVPDPQPSPQATMDLAEFLRQGPNHGDLDDREFPGQSTSLNGSNVANSTNFYGPSSSCREARELRRQRGRGMIVSN